MIKKITSVFLLVTSVVLGQRNSVSPYSAFGIGEDYSPKTVEETTMGGIGVAMQEYNYLNFVNPAATANLRVATYGLAGQTSFVTLKDNNFSQSGNTTELKYVALGFPIGSKAGFSLGLKPMTSMGYSLITKSDIQKSTYKGSGGTNKIYGNFGIDVYKGIKIGVEGAFVFGKFEKSVISSVKEAVLSTEYATNSNLKGLQFKVGMQYKTDLSKNLQLSTGLAFKFGTTLKEKGEETLYSLTYSPKGYEILKRNLYEGADGKKSFEREIDLPTSIILGLGVGSTNKWYVGLNSEFHKAEQNDLGFTNMKYEDKLRTSLGGYYIPKINSISSYWNRVTYRAGIRIEQTGMMMKGFGTNEKFTSINDFGINIGLGLPLPDHLSNLNLGFEYGKRGTLSNNLIKENYFNVRLGLSLNSLNWFVKRKID